MPEFIPATSPEFPYFEGIIPADMFAGKTKEDSETPYPFNRGCVIHTHPEPEKDEDVSSEDGMENSEDDISDDLNISGGETENEENTKDISKDGNEIGDEENGEDEEL